MDALFGGSALAPLQGRNHGHEQYSDQPALVIGASPSPDEFTYKTSEWAI